LRKLTAILLWGIFLFNWVGYRAVHAWLQDRAIHQLEARIDGQPVDPSQLLSFKVSSSHLNYYNTSDHFERLAGHIEINGVLYQYVARRLFNDSAEYLCVPNMAALKLQANADAYYSLVNDLASPEKGSKGDRSNRAPDFFGDPYVVPIAYSFGVRKLSVPAGATIYTMYIPAGMSFPDERPPDSLA
jgi:hypothetical protein